jgi:hypothetical protein
MATKKIKPVQDKPTWGATLSPTELVQLLDRLDQKRKEREMNKMAETLARALEKKQGKAHTDTGDASATSDKKVKKSVPVITGRPMKKAAGRGR